MVTSQISIDQGTNLANSKVYGRIILIHGASGSGKMVSTTSIAELAEMPLFRVGCRKYGEKLRNEYAEHDPISLLTQDILSKCTILLDKADEFLDTLRTAS